MQGIFPLYLFTGLVGALALVAGLTGVNLPFIHNPRSAAIILAVAGFLMCSTGLIALFVTKAPAHPLSLAGYALGILAMLTGVVQIFNLKFPYLSDPRIALLVLGGIIIIKAVIARFNFLLN